MRQTGMLGRSTEQLRRHLSPRINKSRVAFDVIGKCTYHFLTHE